jgi:DNA replication protein DnaC
MKTSLRESLKKLRLSGLAGSLEVRLTEASSSRLTHEEFLELIVQDELAVRRDRLINRRTNAANFRDQKTLEDFDWDFNTSIRRKTIFDLASGEFVRKAHDVLLIGPPGVGKSHLAQGIGKALINSGHTVLYRSIFDTVRDLLHDEAFDGHEKVMQRYLKPDLLILDDMGMKQLPKRSGEFLFEIIMRRHELRSTLMTSNRPLEDWGKLIGDIPAAAAILDRFLQDARLIEMTGKSYRLRGKHAAESDTVQTRSPAQRKEKAPAT